MRLGAPLPSRGPAFDPQTVGVEPLPGEEWQLVAGRPQYAISSFGRVMRATGGRGHRAGRILKRKFARGYPQANLWIEGKPEYRYVHTLVCEAFIGPRPSPAHEVAHIDGNKQNTHVSNLRWVTHRANECDKIAHGTAPRGQLNSQSRLTEETVKAILASRGTTSQIAAKFGISSRHVRQLKDGVRWQHVPRAAPVDADVPADEGWYRITLRRGAPASAVHIFYAAPRDPDTEELMDRPWRWQASVNGAPVPLEQVWPSCAREPITREEHDRLVTRNRTMDDASPFYDPTRRVDLGSAPPPF